MIKTLLPIMDCFESLNLLFFNDNLVVFRVKRYINPIKRYSIKIQMTNTLKRC